MKTKIWKPLCVIAGVIGFNVAMAPAAPIVLMNESFETYAVGSDPTNPGDGNPNNWDLTDATSMAVITGGSPGGGSQSLHMGSNTEHPGLSRLFDAQDGTNGVVYFSADIRFLDNHFTDYNFLINGAGGIGPYVKVRPLDTSGGSQSGISYYNGSTFTSLGNLVQNDWYRVEVWADIDAGTWDVKVTNVTQGSAPVSATGINMWQSPTSLYQWRFVRGPSTATIQADIDNIQITTNLPEPGSVSLLLLTPVALLRRRQAMRR